MGTEFKILVAEDNEDVRELVVMLLETEFTVSIDEVESGNQAIEKLKTENYQLIVSDYNMPDGNGRAIYEYMIENNILTPFVLVSTVIPDDVEIFKTHPLEGFAPKPFFEDKLIEHVQKVMDRTKSSSGSIGKTISYLPIKISTLKRLDRIEFDLFIQLSNNKYVKVEKEAHHLSSENLDHYLGKGMTYLYLEKDHAQSFCQKFKQQLLTTYYIQETDIKKGFDSLLVTTDVVHQMSQSFGLTPELKDIANKNIQVILNQLQNEPKLSDIIDRLESNKDSYFATHCSLLTYICSAMAHAVNWDSEVTHYKLTMASFLHDFTLTDTQIENKQDHILSIERGEFLSVTDVIAVKEHPEKAAKLASEWPVIHPDIDQIISQHHEKPDGSGFPRGITQGRIHPLSALFIVAESLVDFILIEKNKNFEEFFKRYEPIYIRGDFKKVLQAFKQTYKKTL